MKGRVLIIAGSDSGGGAGIQADLKTVTALRGYGGTAITVLTAQDTSVVRKIEPVSSEMVAEQIRMMLDDIGADCIKTGMLYSSEIITVVADILNEYPENYPLVVDPVLISKSGDKLLRKDAIKVLKSHLIVKASLVTPNIPEAEVLSGIRVRNQTEVIEAAKRIRALGASAVLVKGGHMEGSVVTDVLCSDQGLELFENERINSVHTHGTGCSLASAIATGLAQGMNLSSAIRRANKYVFEAINLAPGFGRGHGPLNHCVTISAFKEDI